jgi:threonine aldolase
VETGDDPKDYGRMFDGISICLSKGLGAPVGSLLLGSATTIHKARRIRKVFGGGWRQAGYLAAAGIYALDHHIDRLKEDNLHAKALGEVLKSKSFVKRVLPVDTNIVIFELDPHYSCDRFIDSLAHAGIRCTSFGPHMIRLVTHLDVTPSMIEYTIQILNKLQH